ncbi:MAG: hypothetical protein VW600_00355 [Ferrovibrio sp.]
MLMYAGGPVFVFGTRRFGAMHGAQGACRSGAAGDSRPSDQNCSLWLWLELTAYRKKQEEVFFHIRKLPVIWQKMIKR